MMKIYPHEGVDSVRFGMTRSEVAGVVGSEPRRARRNQYSASDYDFFEALGLFVYYGADEKCDGVELTRRARVSYDGYDLFAHPAAHARAWARARDQDLVEKDGFCSAALGLSMYAPSIDIEEERAAPAQSFLAFRPGYYEEERRRIDAARIKQ